MGPITALTWALEMGEVSRFPSIKQAISYCGLCGDEKRSADKVIRTPLSKQRNKTSTNWWKPRTGADMNWHWSMKPKSRKAMPIRATLAVARKMVAYLLAVDRGKRDFVPGRRSQGRGGLTAVRGRKIDRITQRAGCQVLQVAD